MKLTDWLRELANEEEVESRTISRQHKVRLRPSGRPRRSRLPQCPGRARTKDASQEGALCSAFPARIPHGPDQQVADGNSVSEQDHRGDHPAERGPRREDQRSRRPYAGCVGQFWILSRNTIFGTAPPLCCHLRHKSQSHPLRELYVWHFMNNQLIQHNDHDDFHDLVLDLGYKRVHFSSALSADTLDKLQIPPSVLPSAAQLPGSTREELRFDSGFLRSPWSVVRVRPHMTAVIQGSSHCGLDVQLLVSPPRALACFPPPPRGAFGVGIRQWSTVGNCTHGHGHTVHKRLLFVVGAHSVHLQVSDQLHMSLNRGSSGGALG